MRIIDEHELAPDDNPCEDCNRIRVTPITITNAQWNEIGTDWVKSGGHKKWLVGAEGGKFHYEQVKPFSQYLNELIILSLQSSKALTNLMGKFPDLPDVREVGQ